jgi:NADPH-dependent F420 reductase
MRIGLLGGTGVEGKGLALRFAAAGAAVFLGSRSQERAERSALRYNQILGKPLIHGMNNREMLATSEIVYLTIPFDHVVSAVQSCRNDLRRGLILVDVSVPMRFHEGRAEYLEQPEGSNTEVLAKHIPDGIHLAGAFKTIPAHTLTDIETNLHCDVFVCSDSKDAFEKVADSVRKIPSLRPLDAGSLREARTLERMTVLAINLNRRYKRTGARYRVEGI